MRRLLAALFLLLPLLTSAQPAPDSLGAATAWVAPDTLTTAALPAPPPVDSLRQAAPDTVPAALRSLSAVERQQRGRADAKRYYRPAKGVFWTGAGLGFLSTPLFTAGPVGVGALATTGGAVVMGAIVPRAEKLRASNPQPELLRDPAYRRGYTAQASNKKLGRALLGWGTGATVSLGLIVGTLVMLFPHGLSFGG